MEPKAEGRKSGIRLVVASVFGILVLFLLVLASGSPIDSLGGMDASILYSVFVFAPVLIICGYALRKTAKRDSEG